MIKRDDIFIDFKRDGKIILYPSSCPYHEDFQDVPFDNVILNSHCFKTKRKIGKVYCLNFDNNELLGILKAESISLDALVIMNDGCYEGGNYECVGSLSFFGRVMPLMKPGFEYFADHGHLSRKPGLPNDVLTHKHLPVYLSIFERHSIIRGPLRGRCILGMVSAPKTAKIGRVQVTIHHDSIWNHFDRFDAAYIKCFDERRPSGYRQRKALEMYLGSFNSEKEIFFHESGGREITPFLEDARQKRHSRIAFTPFADDRYETIVTELQNWSAEFPKEITLYHLHRSDYRILYNSFDSGK